MKRTLATSTAICGICLGLAAPAAVAATPTPVFLPSVATAGPAVTEYTDVLGDWVQGADDDAHVVVVPGTDDVRYPRINGIVGGRESTIVTYPESFGPIISGKSGRLLPFFAPTYDQSRDVGTANTLSVMRAFQDADRVVVYTGYSQGSDALGNAVEQAAEEGLLGSDSTILLVSDPRGPWGLKSRLSRTPFATPLMGLFGVDNDGARNPADSAEVKVVQVIVQGDPVAHTQWIWYRPVASVLVNAAGFLAIHSDPGEYTYAHIENLEHVKTLQSVEGNTTYEIYDTYHPLALLTAMVYRAVGIQVSQERLEKWDRAAESFYPTHEITAGDADPKAPVVDVPLSSGGAHRLLDANGEWAEPQQRDGATSDGPRHAAPETASAPETSTVETAPEAIAPESSAPATTAPETGVVAPSSQSDDAAEAGAAEADSANTADPAEEPTDVPAAA